MKYIKFYRYLLPFWKQEALILFFSCIGLGLGLVNPYLSKLVIDNAYARKDLRLFIYLIIIAGIIFILTAATNGLSNYLNRYIRLRINFNLNRSVFKKLQNLSYGFFQENSTGDNLFKISYDIEQASRFIADILPQGISLIAKSVFILAIILFLNLKIALSVFVFVPVLYLASYYFSKKLKKALKVWVENTEGIFTRLEEVLSHMHLVKAWGKERYQIRQYIKNLIRNLKLSLSASRWEAAGLFTNTLVNRAILGLVVAYGGYQIIKGAMTLGSLTAITLYLGQLSGLQNSFVWFLQEINLGLVSCERLDSIFQSQAYLPEDKFAQEVTISQGKIAFKAVTFGYKPEKAVLENLSFCIEGGSCVGLVGPSGCGKTTVVNLILRLYQPLKGEIIIDGYNINSIKSKSLYGQIAVCLQDPYLWNDTITNNIKYAREDADFKEVKEAARIACIDDFIDSLPKGYNTIIGENACKISEGQKQRIAIARALIKRPKILILDEALASVDTQTEEKIIDNIRDFLKNSTLVIISHRPSTISRLDLIYPLAGQLKEERIALDSNHYIP